MSLHPSEEAILKTFVVPAKRDRLLSLFRSPKRRQQARNALNYFAAWDDRFAQLIDSSADVLAILREAGAPSVCHVMSDSSELDGRDMALNEAVSACEAYSFASVLCCVPRKLAFFFDEVTVPRNRVLLRRRGGAG